MDVETEEQVRQLAALYRRHFEAKSYQEGSDALAEAEAFQKRLATEHGQEHARMVDAAAYRIGHG